VLDAMTGIVYEDDELVDYLHVSKHAVEVGCVPRIEVSVHILVLT